MYRFDKHLRIAEKMTRPYRNLTKALTLAETFQTASKLHQDVVPSVMLAAERTKLLTTAGLTPSMLEKMSDMMKIYEYSVTSINLYNRVHTIANNSVNANIDVSSLNLNPILTIDEDASDEQWADENKDESENEVLTALEKTGLAKYLNEFNLNEFIRLIPNFIYSFSRDVGVSVVANIITVVVIMNMIKLGVDFSQMPNVYIFTPIIKKETKKNGED